MGFFDAIGGALKKVGSVAAPIVGGALGGPLGAAIGSGVSGLLGGSGQQIAGGAFAGLTAGQMREAIEQANRDRERARELANQSVGFAQDAVNTQQQQFGFDAPLRNAFRFGALNFADPTNPFARTGMFEQFAANLQQEGQPSGKSDARPHEGKKVTRRAKPRGKGTRDRDIGGDGDDEGRRTFGGFGGIDVEDIFRAAGFDGPGGARRELGRRASRAFGRG